MVSLASRLDMLVNVPRLVRNVAWVGCLCLTAATLMLACNDEPKPAVTLTPTVEPTSTSTPEPTATPSPEPTATPAPGPTATPTHGPTATPTPGPMATSTPEPTATTGPLNAAQVFAEVAPAVAFIETMTGTGSGVLIGGGYVVTNVHVVWPYDTVRVVFSDGSEFEEAPVKGWDLLADLAVLGPIDAAPAAADLADGEGLTIGTDVFLIGYPGETEEFPQPTIVRGLLSRVREWDLPGITYLQTDAPTVGGQSGGALVSETGVVIGISGFTFTEGNFGIVQSSADILPRVDQIIAGGDPSGLGDRQVPLEGGELRHEVALSNLWAQRVYVVNEPSGTVVDIELIGSNDGTLAAYDSFGTELLYLDKGSTGAETGSFALNYDVPHFLIAEQLSETPGEFTLTSTRPLARFDDQDDGKQVLVGQSVAGNIDFHGDVDHFFVHLTEGETIEIVARSTLIDAFLFVDYLGALEEQVIIDDDSGVGLFGLDSRIVYRAPHTGSYFLGVEDAQRYAPGGYVITVAPVDQPDATTTSTTLASMRGASDVASTPSASADFGVDELRSAFTGLPTGFEEVEPSEFDLSIEALSLEDYFSSLAVFLNTEPFEMIMAASGYVDGDRREALDEEFSMPSAALDDVVQGFVSAASGDQERLDLHQSGLLESLSVGARSFGAFFEFTIAGTRLQLELIMFRRGDLVGLVYSYREPGTRPSVSVEGAARKLDAEMSRVVLAR